jgi:hypothetical protein
MQTIKKLLTYLYGTYVCKNLLYLYGSGKVEWKVVWYLNGHSTKRAKYVNRVVKTHHKRWTFQHFIAWNWFVETCCTRERYPEHNV